MVSAPTTVLVSYPDPPWRKRLSLTLPVGWLSSNFRNCPSYYLTLTDILLRMWSASEQIKRTKTNRTEDMDNFEGDNDVTRSAHSQWCAHVTRFQSPYYAIYATIEDNRRLKCWRLRCSLSKMVEHEWQLGIAQCFPVPRWQNDETVMASNKIVNSLLLFVLQRTHSGPSWSIAKRTAVQT